MQKVWFTAAPWLFLALVAVLAANWLRISTALSEIVVGTLAQLVIGALAGAGALNAKTEWITFLAGTGAVALTFLAGAELDPAVFRAKWTESAAVGLTGFFFPFFGAALVAHYLLGWAWRPSWLAGVALSTTSVAVVYAVMLELGFNRTTYGKAILVACFINDLGTAIALGLIFSPFTVKLMRVFMGEADRWHDEPLYDAIVKRLRTMEIAGATVYRGILGYGAKGHQHKRSFFHPTRDLPVMISVIDTDEKIAAAADAVEGMLQDGLIVVSDVDMVRLVRSHTVTEAPHAAGTTR